MSEIKKIPISRIITSGDNPRRDFSEEGLRTLGGSIRTHGLLQPIIVRPRGDYFELVIGERRVRASELVGLTDIEARIEEMDDTTVMELRLIENTHREDLTDAEKGDAVYALWLTFPEKYPTIKSVAEAINTPVGSVRHWCSQSRKLSPKVRKYSARNTITDFQARYLVKYQHATQDRLVETIIERDLTGRQTLELTKLYDSSPETDLNELANRVLGVKKVRIDIEKLSMKARGEVESILEEKERRTQEARKKAMKRATKAPKIKREEYAKERGFAIDAVFSKAEKLKEKLKEVEPKEREKLAKSVGERLDYLTKKVELESELAEDKEMQDLLIKWRANIVHRVDEETPERFVMNFVELLHGIWSRIGVEYPSSVKEVGQRELVGVLSLKQLERLEQTLRTTSEELEQFLAIIHSGLFSKRMKKR